jgi:hypothetical protein
MGKSFVRIGRASRAEDIIRIRNACEMGPVCRTSIPDLFVAPVEGERVPDAPEVIAAVDHGHLTFEPYGAAP